jgi:hypothetical protein
MSTRGSQRGRGWPDVATNVLILIGMDAVLIVMVMLLLKKGKRVAALA